MTNKEYRKAEGISSSDLELLKKSPKHYENKELFKKSGRHFDFGTALHSYVLEPEKFNDEVSISPDFNLRTKKGKEDKQLFDDENTDKIIISLSEFEEIKLMARNINAIAGGLLQNGVAENSYFVTDDLGLKRKCRPDYYIEELGLVIDVKTTKSVKLYDFQKSIFEYNYHRQASYYLDTLKLLNKKADKFIIIAVEKSPPYMVEVFELSQELLESGKDEFMRILQDYQSYLNNHIPNIIKTINLPEWKKQTTY